MTAQWRLLVLAAALSACGDASQPRQAVDSATAQRAANQRPIDPGRALDASRYLSPSAFQSLDGTCIRTDPGVGKSRIVYVLVPSDTTYIRLNVVAGDGAPTMVELVRGASGGRIWTASTHTVNGRPGAVTIQTFASASDRAPASTQVAADGREAQLLRAVASAAMQLSCGSP